MPVDPYDANLQGLWLLTEASGTRYDQTANNNDLTDYNTVTSSADTKRGALSAQFDAAAAEYLEITNAAQTGLNITGALTVCCWAKLAVYEINDDEVLLEKYRAATSERAYMFWLLNTDVAGEWTLRLNVSNNGTAITYIDGTTVLTGGTWYHLAAVYDTSYLRLYVNGVADATPVAYSSGIFSSTAPFRCGIHVDGTWAFGGTMSEAAIWSRALSATEIFQIYTHSILRNRRD